jgi:hypothetical protein
MPNGLQGTGARLMPAPEGCAQRGGTRGQTSALPIANPCCVLSVLHEAGAIHECEEHGWAKDRADPHAREHALDIARQEPPDSLSPDQAVAELRGMLDSIGDTCPECPPD